MQPIVCQLKFNSCREHFVQRFSFEWIQYFFLKFYKMRLGTVIPNFSANTTKGPIQFYDWQDKSYIYLLFLEYKYIFNVIWNFTIFFVLFFVVWSNIWSVIFLW